MTGYSLSLILATIKAVVVAAVDIMVMWFIFYYALRIIRNNSRTIQIFKGIMLVVLVDVIAKVVGLKTLQFISDMFINWGFLAVIIIFQPEIRSLLERMGKTNVFSRINVLSGTEKEKLVDQIVTAVMLLSKDQTGALISIEQGHSLEDFVATGIKINSDVSAELLTSIFVTSTPMHDGAVIIQGDKIACASAYFPPTNMDVPSRYGARHRAAIGISEISDCVTIVVSEETGSVSVTENGKIMTVDREQLTKYLLRVVAGQTTEVKGRSSRPSNTNQPKKNVLSKFAVKKQTEKPSAQKVQVESVKPAENAVVNTTVSDTARIHQAADQEAQAAEMKLPHKKKRPQASYPEQKQQVIPASPAPKRMTPEEVQAARQATYSSLKSTNIGVFGPADHSEHSSDSEGGENV